jgi:hypothetical protein
MHAVMSCVEEADLRADLSWRRDLGDDVLRGVLLRFEGLAGPLGNNEGVLLEGLRDPFSMGRGALFVNRMTEWDGSSLKSGSPEITKAGGMRLHLDELLLSMANRLMELWKMAAKTQANGPGVTSLGWYDKKYDEIVLVEVLYGMRVRGDMRGWNKIPHFVPGGRVDVGGVVAACNFSCTLFWRFSLDRVFWEAHNASMIKLLETVASKQVAPHGAAFGMGGGGGGGGAGCSKKKGHHSSLSMLVTSNQSRRKGASKNGHDEHRQVPAACVDRPPASSE